MPDDKGSVQGTPTTVAPVVDKPAEPVPAVPGVVPHEPVPYDRFQAQNAEYRETQKTLVAERARNDELEQRLERIENPPAPEPVLEGDEVWLDAGVKRHTQPLADKVDKVIDAVEPIQQFINQQAVQQRQTAAEAQLQQFVAQRKADGLDLTPEVQAIMRKTYIDNVVAKGLEEYVTMEDVENSALGVVQKQAVLGRVDLARQQAGQHDQLSAPPVVGRPGLPAPPLPDPDAPVSFADVDTTKEGWQQRFFDTHGDMPMGPTKE